MSGSCDTTLLHEPVWRWAEKTPDALAVQGPLDHLSYAQLASQAGKLARLLQDEGFSRGARLGLLMEGSMACCVGMVAASRAGGCYLPLGVNDPPARLAAVIRDAAPEALATVRAHLPLLAQALALAGVCPKALVVLDGQPDRDTPLPCPAFGREDVLGAPEPRACPSIGQDLAYILYTSGSTGAPKGVMVRHANVRAYLGWMAGQFSVTPEDRFSGHASPTFDISVHDVFGAFYGGASVHPLSTQAQKAFPGPFIAARGITCWNSVPSVIAMMLRSRQLTPHCFPSLRLAVFAGEALAPNLARAWMDALPGCALYNNYGPTETTIVVTWHKVETLEQGRPVPIGRATSPSECLVLDPDTLEPVAPGAPGRLFVRGQQVSAGYWRRPDLTARAFVPNPLQPDLNDVLYDTGDLAWAGEDGVIHYLGRADGQVKVRGHRVELGDVEAALSALDGVIEAAVLAVPGESGAELAACVSGAPEALGARAMQDEEAQGRVLSALARALPPYMLPRRVLFFGELPRNANGKTDRKALDALARSALAGEA